jgi:ferredoxin-NADP reductase
MSLPNAPSASLPTRLLHSCISPSLFDFWMGRLNPLWTLQRPLARLESRRAAACDAVTLTLRPNRHWRGMRAGQHVNLGVEIDGRRLQRSYSPTLLADGRLEVTVKEVAGGVVSGHLLHGARLGEVFALEPAFGDMCLPAVPPPLLLLAAGSGITPMRALLRALAAQGMPSKVDLLYWARRREQLCFVEELQALAVAHPTLSLRLLLTGECDNPAARIDSYAVDDAWPCRRVPGGSFQPAGAGRC